MNFQGFARLSRFWAHDHFFPPKPTVKSGFSNRNSPCVNPSDFYRRIILTGKNSAYHARKHSWDHSSITPSMKMIIEIKTVEEMIHRRLKIMEVRFPLLLPNLGSSNSQRSLARWSKISKALLPTHFRCLKARLMMMYRLGSDSSGSQINKREFSCNEVMIARYARQIGRAHV